MSRFLVDEDLPRGRAGALAARGHETADVRDVGLRGHSDRDIFRYASERSMTLVTADVGFANEVVFPLASHHGLVLARFPNSTPAPVLVATIVDRLDALGDDDLRSCIVVIEPGQIRVRRAG